MVKEFVPISKKECCGCTMCSDICPVSAITIQFDDEGFGYPVINKDLCVKCGLCARVCAFANRSINQNVQDMPKSYVAKHKLCDVRMNSRSGGVFVSCSDYILEQGGVVYGCVLNEDMKAVHMRAVNKKERDLMCRSKYVQSDTKGIYKLVADDLLADKFTLFTGTGCQVDALNSYLKQKKINTDKLYTMDIICHGVPSPMIFSDFIKWTEQKYSGKVIDFNFRDKTKRGWDGYVETFTVNGRRYSGGTYRDLFNTDCSIRPSCYNCKYTNIARVADITIGDAWGIKKLNPEFNDNRGVSLVILNTEKAINLFSGIKETCDIIEVPLEKMLQPNLIKPSKPKQDREKFWSVYCSEGIDSLIKEYASRPVSKRIKENFKYSIRKIKNQKGYYLP